MITYRTVNIYLRAEHMAQSIGLGKRLSIGLATMLIAACGSNPTVTTSKDLQTQADLAYLQGDWQTAEAYYQAIAEAVPDNSSAWLRTGNMRLRQSDYHGAIDAYQTAASAESDGAKSHYNLATSYMMLARESLLKARENLPARDVGQMVIDAKLAHFDALMNSSVAGVTMPESGVFR